MKKMDWTGLRFGKLIVISSAGFLPQGSGPARRKIWNCKCDCGNEIIRKSTYLQGKDYTKSCGCIKWSGEWKGDEVGYEGLHCWIRRHKPKSELCESCGKVPPRDLANISQEYKRDINDFEWLCRRCHMVKDGRIEKMENGFYRGERQGNSKLTEKKVRIIKHAFNFGVRPFEIAKMVGMSPKTMCMIKNGVIWKHVII